MSTSNSMCIWFAFAAIILWMSIYFTGFFKVNWLLYVPATGFVFSAITDICPSQIAISKIFGLRRKETSN